MKTLFILFGLVLALTAPNFSQTTGANVGPGTVWTDSLWFSDDDDGAEDSTVIYNMNFSKEWFTIFLKGNSNSPADSLIIIPGSIQYNERKQPIDTIWGSWAALKDSSWSDTNVLVNNTVGVDYVVYRPVFQLFKLTIINHRATLDTRKLEYTIQAK